MTQFDPDSLAATLARFGAIARSMPPAWDGAEISQPVLSPTHGTLGRMLPGRGFYLPFDLKYLGINRPIPNVYETTKVSRLIDRWRAASYLAAKWADTRAQFDALNHWMRHPERGAIASYDNVISERAAIGGTSTQYDSMIAKSYLAPVALAWTSIFRDTGLPVAGSYTAITGGAAHSSATTGAWSFGLSNPTGGDKAYLATFGFCCTQQINMLLLHDMLVAAGNISGTSAVTQTINTTALTRSTDGAGVMMTYEVTTTLGVTAATINTTYTNQAGTGSRTTGAISIGVTSAASRRLVPIALGPFIQLASGDYGVRSVQSCILSVSTGAGTLAVILYKPICWMPGIAANVYVERDSTIQIDGLSEIAQTSGAVLACLNAFILPNTAVAGVLTATFKTVQG